MPHYYVEMPNSPNTLIDNHEEYQLVVDLDNVTVESEDPIGSNQSEKVKLVHMLSLLTLLTKRRQGNKPLVDYSNSHICGNIRPIFGYSKTEGCVQRIYR